MKKRKTKKQTSYICLVCGKGKKSTRRVKCCSQDMTAKKRGSWNL